MRTAAGVVMASPIRAPFFVVGVTSSLTKELETAVSRSCGRARARVRPICIAPSRSSLALSGPVMVQANRGLDRTEIRGTIPPARRLEPTAESWPAGRESHPARPNAARQHPYFAGESAGETR
jgi:hypothetical protein